MGNSKHKKKGSSKSDKSGKESKKEGLIEMQESSGNSAVQRYAEAYDKARTYHSTWEELLDPGEHGGGIRAEGLTTEKGGTGLSQMSGVGCTPAFNEGTVHVTTPERGEYYNGMMGASKKLRPFLPPERTVKHRNPTDFNKPEANRGELFRDREDEFGSWITGEDIAPEHINFGSNRELLVEGSDELFAIIGQHMEDAPTDTATLRLLHEEALDEEYLSD